jgi:hypothetical protein
MHKPKLRLEMLAVESFTTDAGAGAARGTVDAHAKPTETCGPCSIVPESQDCPATIYPVATCNQYSCDPGCQPLTYTCEP